MRLQVKEIQQILQVARDIYGNDVKVYLFGSRTDDTRRGGDIDLLIRTSEEKKGILSRVRMIARLKHLLGDQKIDVIGGSLLLRRGGAAPTMRLCADAAS